jgi:predicted nuclease of predicted toxin-antitoxin system
VRLLANENIPADTVAALGARGHDVAWILAEAPGLPDPEVLARAQTDGRIWLTFDKDFGELAFRSGLPASSGIVLFRIAAPSVEHVTRIIVAALDSRSDWAGHFAVVEDDQIRLASLPERKSAPDA